MKNILLLAIILGLGWSGYSFFSAYLHWTQFEREVDSFLQTPREMNEGNLPGLILNKADQFGLELNPGDIYVKIAPIDQGTSFSKEMESKGFTAEHHVLTLHLQASQSVLWMKKEYTMDRERRFTSRIAPSSQTQTNLDEAFSN